VLPDTQKLVRTTSQKLLVQFYHNFTGMKSSCANHRHFMFQWILPELYGPLIIIFFFKFVWTTPLIPRMLFHGNFTGLIYIYHFNIPQVIVIVIATDCYVEISWPGATSKVFQKMDREHCLLGKPKMLPQVMIFLHDSRVWYIITVLSHDKQKWEF
jgi:hypothetical protein